MLWWSSVPFDAFNHRDGFTQSVYNRYVFTACVQADDEKLRLSEQWPRRTTGLSNPGTVQHHIRRADVALHQFDAKIDIEYRTSPRVIFHEHLSLGKNLKRD
jgi:hypothetical protein